MSDAIEKPAAAPAALATDYEWKAERTPLRGLGNSGAGVELAALAQHWVDLKDPADARRPGARRLARGLPCHAGHCPGRQEQPLDVESRLKLLASRLRLRRRRQRAAEG